MVMMMRFVNQEHLSLSKRDDMVPKTPGNQHWIYICSGRDGRQEIPTSCCGPKAETEICSPLSTPPGLLNQFPRAESGKKSGWEKGSPRSMCAVS